MRHQKGADSLRLGLLLMGMMMFCLEHSRSVFATMIPVAVTCGDDSKIQLTVYYDL